MLVNSSPASSAAVAMAFLSSAETRNWILSILPCHLCATYSRTSSGSRRLELFTPRPAGTSGRACPGLAIQAAYAYTESRKQILIQAGGDHDEGWRAD